MQIMVGSCDGKRRGKVNSRSQQEDGEGHTKPLAMGAQTNCSLGRLCVGASQGRKEIGR